LSDCATRAGARLGFRFGPFETAWLFSCLMKRNTPPAAAFAAAQQKARCGIPPGPPAQFR